MIGNIFELFYLLILVSKGSEIIALYEFIIFILLFQYLLLNFLKFNFTTIFNNYYNLPILFNHIIKSKSSFKYILPYSLSNSLKVLKNRQ